MNIFLLLLAAMLVLYQLFWIGVESYLIRAWKHPATADFDASYLFQVSEDWETRPFVDVIMTSDDRCPQSHEEEVFYELWKGATILCDCIQREQDHKAFPNTHCLKGKNQPHNGDDCWEQPPMPPVVQASIHGVRVCGKRGGSSFLNAVRNSNTVTGG